VLKNQDNQWIKALSIKLKRNFNLSHDLKDN